MSDDLIEADIDAPSATKNAPLNPGTVVSVVNEPDTLISNDPDSSFPITESSKYAASTTLPAPNTAWVG